MTRPPDARHLTKTWPKAQATYETFAGSGVFGLVTPEAVTLWNDKVGLDPGTVVRNLLGHVEGTPRISLTTTEEAALKLDFDLRDAQGQLILDGIRYFCFADRMVKHTSLEVHGDKRGLARPFLKNSAELYKLLGLTLVSTWADVDVGAYAWAKYGWLPDNREESLKLKDAVKGRAAALARRFTSSTSTLYKVAMADNDLTWVWDISDLEQELDGEKVGKTLLRGTGWNGTLDLGNLAAMARFNDYVRGY